MRTLSNIIWLVFGGLWTAFIWALLGVLFYITIIGILLGRQSFKFAELMLMPYGKKVKTNFGKHPIINIIWIVVIGWAMAVMYLGIGIVSILTIIGIPAGFQWFKFIKLSLMPFGATIK